MTEARGTSAATVRVRRVLATLGLPELFLLSFYAVVAVGLSLIPRDSRLDLHLALVSFLALLYLGGAILLRPRTPDTRLHPRRIPRRLLTLVVIFGMYFQLRWIIPALHPHDFDASLSAVDTRIFGAPIAQLLVPYTTGFWVEWFSFFYWTYFYVLAAYVIGHIVFDRDGARFAPLGAGLVLIHALGWLGYLAVPGLGPYAHLQATLEPLPGSTFYAMTLTSTSWGPLRDIFPSIHTALMTFISLHALRNLRRHLVYKIVAFPLAFWALQIIAATLYCRWHYAVDVLAGFGLAFLVTLAVEPLCRRWALFRSAAGELDPHF